MAEKRGNKSAESQPQRVPSKKSTEKEDKFEEAESKRENISEESRAKRVPSKKSTEKAEKFEEAEPRAKPAVSHQGPETGGLAKKIEREDEEQAASEEKVDRLKRRKGSTEDRASPTPSVGSVGSEEETEGPEDFDSLYVSFVRFGDRGASEISLRSVDKWFGQANLFDENLSTVDTGITFAKIAKSKKRLSKQEFEEMLEELASEKGMEVEEIKGKLESAGRPSYTGVTRTIRGSVAADSVQRLTDPALYTGSHRERFDEEGRGRGLSGRYDEAANDGYVQGYRRSSEEASP